MTLRSFSVHAHFYQPPREDPFTGMIPVEPNAHPYLNWNERIHNECYQPNEKLGNFGHISFNLGPTLSAWMENYDPTTYQGILAQDKANLKKYGVGNAIAQAFNHTILPLASYHDKVTQVAWGIADFEHRFGRKPQGMWLPETAVDRETLSVLADQGIEFTILAPWQADVDDLDVTEPYLVDLPEGKQIAVFFYHSELSGGISFNPTMTVNADDFARFDLASRYRQEKIQRGEPQLILIASDGELYGHHQPHRDLFLAHLVNGATTDLNLAATFPGLWLTQYGVRKRITIRENTAWSCRHGLRRWKGECDCTPGGGGWKEALRLAFDRLAARLDKLFYDTTCQYVDDPWELRKRYIAVILGEQSSDELIASLAGRRLELEIMIRLRLLLAAQRERQRMYTSCGWFFDDFDRIEPKNDLAYAIQAIRLTQMATGVDLMPEFLSTLKHVRSKRTGLRGDQVAVDHMRRAALASREINSI